jgi:hypothetical protein
MPDIVISGGVSKILRSQSDINDLIARVKDVTSGFEGGFFVPYPANDKDQEMFKDKQVRVLFVCLYKSDELASPLQGKEVPMVMITPLYLKSKGCNIWYVQMKDEFGKIQLEYATEMAEGHTRTKKVT